jgi:thiol:disulfide interchange protein DsbG
MKRAVIFIIACLVTASLIAACSASKADGADKAQSASADNTITAGKPAPIRALEQQGLKIEGKFKAPDGLTGYAASFRGRPVAVYLMPGSNHAIVGTMIDGQGQDLSSAPLERIVVNPKNQKAWAQLQHATWVTDGSKDAARTIYMFTDPNCPYCHQFWRMARPWVKSGKVQIRHVLVGILKPSSMPKAASILAADDPSQALDRSEQEYEGGGIKALDNPPADVEKQIHMNTSLMKSLGFYATPTIVYRDEDGNVSVTQGVPQGQQAMTEVMGSATP